MGYALKQKYRQGARITNHENVRVVGKLLPNHLWFRRKKHRCVCGMKFLKAIQTTKGLKLRHSKARLMTLSHRYIY